MRGMGFFLAAVTDAATPRLFVGPLVEALVAETRFRRGRSEEGRGYLGSYTRTPP
jgi:hypothetical protein